MKRQQGFTLIDNMIVVTIIGILAGLAVQSYQDYVVRAKLAEVIVMMSGVKPLLLSEYQTVGVMPQKGSAISDQIENTLLNSKYIDNVEYVRNGKSPLFAMVHVRLTNLGSGLDGKLWSFYFRPDDLDRNNPVKMKCYKYHIPDKYVPNACRML